MRSLVFLAGLFGPASAWPRPSLDATTLAPADSSLAEERRGGAADARPSETKSRISGLKGLGSEDASELRDSIDSMTLLLSRHPAGAVAARLLLNRAVFTFSLARLRLAKGAELKKDAESRSELVRAAQDVNQALQTKDIEASQKPRAYFFAGLIRLYQDQSSTAFFRESLRLDADSENAPWMALEIAEDEFDAGRFGEAIRFYQRYFARFNATQQELALYKMAWCHINLHDNAAAEADFKRVITYNKSTVFRSNAIKDLAFFMAQFSQAPHILQTASEIFPRDGASEMEFLSDVNAYFEIHNAVDLNSAVIVRLMRLENDPIRRLQFLLSAVRALRKGYASRDHLIAFSRVEKNVEAAGRGSLDDRDNATVRARVEAETNAILRSFVETYSGRVKTPESIGRDEIGRDLKGLFRFQSKTFPKSPQHATVMKLWLEVCADLKDHVCVDQVADLILDDSALARQYPTTLEYQVSALDQLQAKEPKKYRKRFTEKADDYLEKYPKGTEWMNIAKRLGAVRSDAKDFEKALPILIEVADREASADNLYRLEWARFNAEKYADIVNDARLRGTRDPRLGDLRREATLKIAIASKSSGDGDEYVRAARDFLSQGPNADKARIVRKDLISHLVKVKNFAQAQIEIAAIPRAERGDAIYADPLTDLWKHWMLAGNFQNAADTDSTRSTYRFVLSQLAQASDGAIRASLPTVRHLETAQKFYVAQLLALLKPKFVIDDLAPVAGRDLLALALQIASSAPEIPRNARNVKLLGSGYPFRNASDDAPLAFERELAGLHFPDASWGEKRYLKAAGPVLTVTRKVRERVSAEIDHHGVEVQVRALRAAALNEAKVAEMLLHAPRPATLAENQVEAYQKGIETSAKEFSDQSAEFAKAEGKLREQMEAARRARQKGAEP